ncbi:hypothetical protein [Deinococcus radiodurans]|uniref:hypothetical protein n=1 Tax=Deinococcus radiodurans TaxID=1299 RepID=UPI00312C8B61
MKWLTAALLTVAAVLAGLLVYRSAAPGRGGLRGGTALDTPLAVPPLPLTDDRGARPPSPRRTGGCGWCFSGTLAAPTCARSRSRAWSAATRR